MSAASGVLLPGFVGTSLPSWLARRLRDGLAGVCLFGENIVSIEQVRALTDSIREANPHALIAIDEEGGDVTRLHYAHGSPYPGNAILGRLDDLALTERVAAHVAGMLRLTGINLNLAPVADVNSNPLNPVIGIRSFGATPELVARHTAAWVRGLEGEGVASSPKHFPGHGDTSADSHLAMPVISKSLTEFRDTELVPFLAAIGAGASTIMTSHILLSAIDPAGPVTFSHRVLRGLLRDELGFDGVIVSDALDMHGASGDIGIPAAAVRALAGGCDLLCIGTRNTDEQLSEIEATIERAVVAGELTDERVTDAAARVTALAQRFVVKANAPAGDHDTAAAGAAEPIVPLTVPLTRVIDAFDVRPGTDLTGPFHLIGLDTVANIAVGTVPWAPFVTSWLSEGDSLGHVPQGSRLMLIGRDNHRHPWVRDIIELARATHPDAVVVDMGWPSNDRAWADIATFGASRLVGDALLELLGGAHG